MFSSEPHWETHRNSDSVSPSLAFISLGAASVWGYFYVDLEILSTFQSSLGPGHNSPHLARCGYPLGLCLLGPSRTARPDTYHLPHLWTACLPDLEPIWPHLLLLPPCMSSHTRVCAHSQHTHPQHTHTHNKHTHTKHTPTTHTTPATRYHNTTQYASAAHNTHTFLCAV